MKSKIISIFSSIGAVIFGCFGSCGIVCFASGCCGGAVLFGLIGLSGSTMSFLSKLTPFFLALTVISLGYAFYNAYKPKPANNCCNDNSEENSNNCCTPKKKNSFLKSKTFLWLITVLCIIMWSYPLIFKNNSKNTNNFSNCSPKCQSDTNPGPNYINIK